MTCPAGGFKPQFFPQLDGIMQLFQRPATAASLLLHIYAINLFLGRTICLEGGWVRACRAGRDPVQLITTFTSFSDILCPPWLMRKVQSTSKGQGNPVLPPIAM